MSQCCALTSIYGYFLPRKKQQHFAHNCIKPTHTLFDCCMNLTLHNCAERRHLTSNVLLYSDNKEFNSNSTSAHFKTQNLFQKVSYKLQLYARLKNKNKQTNPTCNLQNSGRHVCDPEPIRLRKSFSESVFTCYTQWPPSLHMWLTMAGGDVGNTLDDCIKRINANTEHLENFLRQVFYRRWRVLFFFPELSVATLLTDVRRQEVP